MLLYVRNIPEKYGFPLIKKETLTNLIAKGFNQVEIAKKTGHSNSTVCRSIKGYEIQYHRPPLKWKPRIRKTTEEERERFERKIKRNYAEATVYLKKVLVMYQGKLENTEIARKWWDKKIGRAWGRRHWYGGI